MTENIDVIIAFVIVIVGLAMTLQLLTEILKTFLGLRWSVYEAFIRDLYHSYMGAESCGEMKRGTKDSIQSVDKRFRAFAEKVGQLCAAFREIRAGLTSLQVDLVTQVDEGAGKVRERQLEEKIAILRAHLKDGVPGLAAAVEQIQAVKPDSLLRIYQELFGSQSLALTVEQRKALSGLEALVARSVDETKQEVVDAVESSIKAILEWLCKIERRAVKVHTSIQANMNDALARLEDSYTKSLKKRAFWYGLLMCLLLNADSVTIFQSLRESSVLTSSVIQRQEGFTTVVASSFGASELNDLTQKSQKLATMLRSGRGGEFGKWHESAESMRKTLAANERVLEGHPGFQGLVDLNLVSIDKKMAAAKKQFGAKQLGEAAKAVDQASAGYVKAFAQLELARARMRLSYLAESGLPLGWTIERLNAVFASAWSALQSALGILLTAFLISFGAPIWNDLLKSLLSVKGFLRGRKEDAEYRAT